MYVKMNFYSYNILPMICFYLIYLLIIKKLVELDNELNFREKFTKI